MNELSIFIDESGDFGEYNPHSPYYIITMVFHNQTEDIQPAISRLNRELSYLKLDNMCIHTGPIIRKEEIYKNMSVHERRRIFNKMVAFIRQINIRYKCFYIEKKHIADVVEATGLLSKQISQFVREYYTEFLSFDDVKYTMITVRWKLVKYFPLFSMLCFQTQFFVKLCPQNINFFKQLTSYVH